MSLWTLKIGAVTQSLADWNIPRFDCRLVNLGIDTLVLRENPVDLNTPRLMVYDDVVVLYEDAVQVFAGLVTKTPKQGLPGQIETREYTVAGSMDVLNRIVYEQDWHSEAATTYFKGRVHLGRDINGDQLEVGEAIKDILDFADGTTGFSIDYTQADLDTLDTLPPANQVVDHTCYECIRKLLQWEPDVQVWIDYSAATPRIRFVRRASAASAPYDIDDLQALSINPRDDLAVDGVWLIFETFNTVDGDTYTDISEQKAGTTTGLNVLKQTLDLNGIESSSTVQEVKATAEAIPADLEDLTFWQTYVAGLSLFTGTPTISSPVPTGGGAATYGNVLVKGSVPVWTNKNTIEEEFTAKITGTLDGQSVTNLPIAVTLVLTDSDVGEETYSQLTSSSFLAAEVAPAGLADALYAARQDAPYEGRILIIADEPDFSLHTGKVINLTGGETAWQTMDAPIDSVTLTRTLDNAFNSINFGPPKHLAPQDYVELIRASRTRVQRSWTRKDPLNSDGGKIEENGHTPNSNGNMLGGGTGLPSTSSLNNDAMLIFDKSAGTVAWLEADEDQYKVFQISGAAAPRSIIADVPRTNSYT